MISSRFDLLADKFNAPHLSYIVEFHLSVVCPTPLAARRFLLDHNFTCGAVDSVTLIYKICHRDLSIHPYHFPDKNFVVETYIQDQFENQLYPDEYNPDLVDPSFNPFLLNDGADSMVHGISIAFDKINSLSYAPPFYTQFHEIHFNVFDSYSNPNYRDRTYTYTEFHERINSDDSWILWLDSLLSLSLLFHKPNNTKRALH